MLWLGGSLNWQPKLPHTSWVWHKHPLYTGTSETFYKQIYSARSSLRLGREELHKLHFYPLISGVPYHIWRFKTEWSYLPLQIFFWGEKNQTWPKLTVSLYRLKKQGCLQLVTERKPEIEAQEKCDGPLPAWRWKVQCEEHGSLQQQRAAPAESQLGSRDLSPAATRNWIPPRRVSLKVNFSPQLPDENSSLGDRPWFQPLDTLSREPSHAVLAPLLTNRADNKEVLFEAAKFVVICYTATEN